MDRNLRIRVLMEASDRATRPLRDIANGGSRASQALRATRQRLQEIERSRADITAFRQLKAGARTTEQAMQAATARVARLSREIAQTGQPTRGMTRDLAAARQEAARLTRQHETETRELQQLRDRLRAAGVETSSLARHERDLRQESERTNRELTEQERHLERVANRHRRFAESRNRFGRLQGMAGGMAANGAAAIGTGLVVAAPILGSIKAAQDYESVMTDIGQKADLSRAASAGLGRNLLEAAKAANRMPEEMQAGVDALAGLGATVPNAVAMMTPIGRAATAYKAEIADLSNAAFAATDNLKVPVAQTQRVIDIMAQAGKSGAFEIKDMAQYFPSLTAAYQGLGQTGTGAVADLAAGLQIARKGAGDAATAATNIANVLQKVTSPATNRAFAKMGVDLPKALKKAYSEGKTPLEAIAELTNKTLKGDLSKLGYLFEDAQVQQGLRPLIQNMEEYRRIRSEAAGASGTTDRDFAERLKDSAEQTQQLKVNATTLAITLGNQLLPTVNAVVTKATAFARWIGDLANRYPNATKAVVFGTAAFAALFFVVGGGAIVLAGLVASFATLSLAAGIMGVGLLPVIGIAIGVVAAIIGIGAAAYALYANWGSIWGGIKATVNGGIGSIAAALVNFSPVGLLWRGISALLGLMGVTVPARLTDAGRWMIRGLINGITGMLGALKNTIVNAASSAAGWFKQKLDIRSPSRVFTGYGGFMMEGLGNGIDAGRADVIRRVGGVAGSLMATMANASLPTPALSAPAVVQRFMPTEPRPEAQRIDARAPNVQRTVSPRPPAIFDSPRAGAFPMQAVLELPRIFVPRLPDVAPPPPIVQRLVTDAGIVRSAITTGERARSDMRQASEARERRAPARSPAPVSVTNHITIQALPGMDEAALARAVAAELDRRERQRVANARSTYRDDPDGADL